MSTNVDPQIPYHGLNDSVIIQFKLDSHIATKNSSHTINQNNENKKTNKNTRNKSATTTPNNDVIMAKSPEN